MRYVFYVVLALVFVSVSVSWPTRSQGSQRNLGVLYLTNGICEVRREDGYFLRRTVLLRLFPEDIGEEEVLRDVAITVLPSDQMLAVAAAATEQERVVVQDERGLFGAASLIRVEKLDGTIVSIIDGFEIDGLLIPYGVNYAFVLQALTVLVVFLLADTIVSEWRRNRRRKAGKCPSCGYDRFGLEIRHPCPECGKFFTL